jgi:insulysin
MRLDMNDILEKNSSHIKEINGIYVPVNDNLNHRTITLKNKLRIFFVETKDSNISSATMYVGVGNIDNPRDIDGMAHYLEHMLFMGSDEYQGGTYFQNQVSNKGGSTNAYTSDDHTQYYFYSSEDFTDLLKIFSRFFIKPLFDIKYVEKEVSAVDSEHKKNIGSDDWRTMNLGNRFFIDGVNDRFSTGTKETLLGDSVGSDPETLRHRLVEFYGKYYSADRMVLYISHKTVNDDFVDRIGEMFESVPLHDTSHTDNTAKVKILDGEYELIKIKTVNENNYLTIKWLTEGSDRFKDNLCETSYDVISHILGHEGQGSLYDILIKRGLIIDMAAGIESSFERNCMFTLQMKLTNIGYENMENILYIIDAYIKYLVQVDDSSSELFDNFFEETKQLTLLYMTTMDNTDGLSICQHYAEQYNKSRVDLQYVPISGLLIGDGVIAREHFKNVLRTMTLSMAKVVLTSPLFDEAELPSVEKYYGTQYDHIQVPVDLNIQEKLSKFDFKIPQLNTYLSRVQNMQIVNTIEKDDPSYCSVNSETNNVYFVKRGNIFNTYTISGYILINFESLKTADPIRYIALLIYCMYIKKIKQADMYQLRSAKIMVSVVPDKDRITISMDGYDSDLGIDNIFKQVMEWYGIVGHDQNNIHENTYELVYNDIKTELQNYQYSDAYTMIGPEFRNMINETHSISNDQMIKALDTFAPKHMKDDKNKINYKNFRSYCVDLMTTGNVIGVFGGSINMKRVNRIIKMLDESIKNVECSSQTTYTIPRQNFSSEYVKKNQNPNNRETAIGYGLYLGNVREIQSDSWMIKKPMCMMLEGFISEKFSASVRTEKQVGYIAISNIMNVNQSNNADLFLLFVTQSTRDDLKNIVKEYVDNHMLQDVVQMSEDEFNSMKQGVITSMSEKPLNINADCSEKISTLMDTYEDIKSIKDINVRFSRKKIMTDATSTIDKSMFVDFVKNILDTDIRSIILIVPSHVDISQKN